MAFLTNLRLQSAALLFASIVCIVECSASVWGQAVNETEAKATFLYHFTHFVAWPPRSLSQNPSPFVIGILGEDPFGNVLDQTIRDEVVEGRKIVVERYSNLASLKACQILFISRSEESRLDEILSAIKDKPILTVAEIPQFAKRGGTINLITERNKIRIALNISTTQARQLTFSSNLLRVAEIIGR